MLLSSAELTTYDWLKLSIPELVHRGASPEDRGHYTGHLVALSQTWLPSLGNWGILDTADLIDTRAPHKGRIKVLSNAYRQFKFRNGLMTGTEFMLQHGPEEWLHAELSHRAYVTKQKAFYARNGVEASLGQACRAIAEEGKKRECPLHYRLGLLPAEIVLYARVFAAFLGDSSYDDWDALDPEDKAATWAQGPPDAQRWDIDLFATTRSVRHLEWRRHAGL